MCQTVSHKHYLSIIADRNKQLTVAFITEEFSGIIGSPLFMYIVTCCVKEHCLEENKKISLNKTRCETLPVEMRQIHRICFCFLEKEIRICWNLKRDKKSRNLREKMYESRWNRTIVQHLEDIEFGHKIVKNCCTQ